MRLAQRLPVLRGFNNPFRKEFAIVNLADLEDWTDDSEINPATLAAKRLIRSNEADGYVKILGDGELTHKITVRAHKFTATARQKIEAVGGTIIEIPIKTTVQTKRGPKTDAATS